MVIRKEKTVMTVFLLSPALSRIAAKILVYQVVKGLEVSMREGKSGWIWAMDEVQIIFSTTRGGEKVNG